MTSFQTEYSRNTSGFFPRTVGGFRDDETEPKIRDLGRCIRIHESGWLDFHPWRGSPGEVLLRLSRNPGSVPREGGDGPRSRGWNRKRGPGGRAQWSETHRRPDVRRPIA